jgi:hypothetical protein
MAPSTNLIKYLPQFLFEPPVGEEEQVDPECIPAKSGTHGKKVCRSSSEPDGMGEGFRVKPQNLVELGDGFQPA